MAMPVASTAEIVLSRSADARTDRLRRYRVLIDDEEVAKLKPGEQKRFEVAPGTHEIQLKVDWGSSVPMTLTLEGGERANLLCEPTRPREQWTFTGGFRLLKQATFGRAAWIALRRADSSGRDGAQGPTPRG
jgi:hypothetical protein